MSKKFVILLDNNNKKQVYASKWLTEDKKMIAIPSDTRDLKKLIIQLADPEDNWTLTKFQKIIKYNDTFNGAVSEANINDIENITEPSDEDKMKSSRNKRNRNQKGKDFFEGSITKKNRIDKSSFTSRTVNVNEGDNSKADDDYDMSSDDLHISDKQKHDDNSKDEMEGLISNKSIVVNNIDKVVNRSFDEDNSENIDEGNDESTAKETLSVEDAVSIRKELNDFKDILKEVLKKLHEISGAIRKVENNMKNMKTNRKESELNTDLSLSDRTWLESSFPVDNEHKLLQTVESALQKKKHVIALINYIKTISGKNARDGIITVLPRLMKDKVLIENSYKGQGTNKETKEPNKCFKDLMICKCIYEGVKDKYNGVDEEVMKESVSSWLDSAKTRLKRKSGK